MLLLGQQGSTSPRGGHLNPGNRLRLPTPAAGGGGLWIFPYVGPRPFPLQLSSQSFGCFHFIYSVEHGGTRRRVCSKLECLPAALAVAPLHLSARGEEKKLNALNSLLLTGAPANSKSRLVDGNVFGTALHSHGVELACARSF